MRAAKEFDLTTTPDFSEYLLPESEKPEWLKYPPVFCRVLESGLIDFHPWHILNLENVRRLREVMIKSFYPDEALIPLARKMDCDYVACFDKSNIDGISIFDLEFRGKGGRRRTFPSFYEWFRSAMNDFLEFEPSEDNWHINRR
jgi:hypothetical protein